MRWEEFVEKCNHTIDDNCKNYEYLAAGLISEVGEVAGKLKKYIRRDPAVSSWIKMRAAVKYEIGDVLWYVAMLDMYCVFINSANVATPMLGNKLVYRGENQLREIVQLNQVVSDITAGTCGEVTKSMIWTLVVGCERVANSFGLTLSDCASAVVDKLSQRKENGTLKGDGDGVIR